MDPADDPLRPEEVEAKMARWRQGDCVVGSQPFLFLCSLRCPLSQSARELAAESKESSLQIAAEEVMGLTVVSQTCDIVRSCRERPFLEVVPLVEVDESVLADVRKWMRPRYAALPALLRRRLAADLDRVMSIEKAVAVGWERTPGCRNDKEARDLAFALARKRSRPAFPDDFVDWSRDLVKRIRKKHGKDTDEARMLGALCEIRVKASPDWDHNPAEVMFFFLKSDDAPDSLDWVGQKEEWLALLPHSGRFRAEGIVATLDDLTARDYQESDRLDLDQLSRPNTPSHEAKTEVDRR